MDAVEILFGFYKTIPGFFQQVWGTAEAEPEPEEEAQPEPETPKLPELDWPGVFEKIIDVLQPFEEALWKVSDLVMPLFTEHEARLKLAQST